MVKQDRSLAMLILLSIITCGIYPLFFWYKMAEDMNIMCKDDGDHTTDGVVMVLLFLFTCGIYQYIWFYQVANRLQSNARRYGTDLSESGSTVLLWMILGMFIAIGPLIALYIVIKNSNTVAALYNRNNGGYGGNYNNSDNRQNYISSNNAQNYNVPNNTPQNNYGAAPQRTSGQSEYMKTQPLSQEMGNQGSAVLTCRSGEFSGASFPIGVNEKIVIGRELDCNIKFESTTPNVSRRHCTVEYDGRTMWLTDNNSSCGTFLTDGTRLTPMKRTPLNTGMGFYLGNRDITFYI